MQGKAVCTLRVFLGLCRTVHMFSDLFPGNPVAGGQRKRRKRNMPSAYLCTTSWRSIPIEPTAIRDNKPKWIVSVPAPPDSFGVKGLIVITIRLVTSSAYCTVMSLIAAALILKPQSVPVADQLICLSISRFVLSMPHTDTTRNQGSDAKEHQGDKTTA